MSSVKEIFGRNVKKYRKQFGYTQEEMAEKIDVSQTFFANLERGNRGASFETVELIARCFNIPCASLFEENESDKTETADYASKLKDALFYRNLERKLQDYLSHAVHQCFEEEKTS